MASLQQESTGTFHIVFRVSRKRYKRSLFTKSESQARSLREDIEETLKLIERGKISIPESISIVDYLFADVRPTSKPEQPQLEPSSAGLLQKTIKSVFDQFFDSIPNGNIEAGTIEMMQIHKRHLLRILKPSFDVTTLTGHHLQQYINARSKERTQFIDTSKANARKKPVRTFVSAPTIRKEITTLGAAWRWGKLATIVEGTFPNRGLRYPKTDEKPPFQTWAEIERQIESEGLTGRNAAILWDCLFLRQTEIERLLAHIKRSARHPFIYPMCAMAAYTGARRSELLRSRRADFDFAQNIATIRERKRVKGRRSTRRVPMTDNLCTIMQHWFESDHPGSQATFVHSKSKIGLTPLPVTRDQAQSHLRKTLEKSRWQHIKGWHCFRHSFISNLACAGIDQRIIDDFVGHTTEDMRRRYRHLFPDVKHAAINQVFG